MRDVGLDVAEGDRGRYGPSHLPSTAALVDGLNAIRKLCGTQEVREECPRRSDSR
jgi:hypothetical protein